MFHCSLLVLSTVVAGAAPTPYTGLDAFMSTAAPAPVSAAPLYQRGGIVMPHRPTFFISGGYHVVEAEHNWDEEDDEAISIDLGYLTWSGDMGFALEAGVMRSSFETDITVFQKDDVDTTRYLLGLRFIDSTPDSRFAPYLRGGYMYREDKGDVVDDDGSGWYLGGGIDFKVGYGFTFGPQLLYAENSSLDATEWLLGVTGTIAF